MAQWLNTWAALPKDSGLIFSNAHGSSKLSLTPVPNTHLVWGLLVTVPSHTGKEDSQA